MGEITRIHEGRYAHLLNPDRPREFEASFTLDRHIADARESMGADRWGALNAQWEADEAETARLLEEARVEHGFGSPAYRAAVRRIRGRAV